MKFCNHCGHTVVEEEKFCSNCGNRIAKRKNMLLYFFLMIILFIILDITSNLLYSETYSIIVNSKYTKHILIESLWIIIILFVLNFAGNGYIFEKRRKRISIFKSLKLAFPPVIIAIFAFNNGILNALDYNLTDSLGLLIYCITIGIAEELLCRGWLLTEFIERYGYDYKHVKLSILLSALVFGFMHITNILYGQTVFDTITQIIQTLGMGYLLGSVFYRTRNIWSVIFIHAFYDFSLMLTDIAPFSMCSGGIDTPVQTLAISIILFVLYIILGQYNLRKSKTYDLLPEVKELTEKDIIEEKSKIKIYKALIIVCIFAIYLVNYTIPLSTTKCTVYPNKPITENYTINEYHYKSYELSDNYYKYTVTKKDSGYYLINQVTNEELYLTSIDNKVIVFQNKKYFVIAIYDKENEKIIYYRNNYYVDEESNDKVKIEFAVPKLTSFNTITFENGESYIHFTSDDLAHGMIDSDNNLYEIKAE